MLSDVPAELRACPQWVCWRHEERDGKLTKVPYNPRTGQRADVTDPDSWADFDTAQRYINGTYSGVGFVFTRNAGFTGIDLDIKNSANTPDPADWTPQADIDRLTRIYDAIPSYAERSPSGQGAHIIVRGYLPEGRRRGGVEIYSENRFFTVTGDVLRPAPIVEGGYVVTKLWEELAPKFQAAGTVDAEQRHSDEDIWIRASAARNGEQFQALWRGEWQNKYPSQSEADQALLNTLAFYTQNQAQLARLFRLSALGQRDKAKRDKYVFDTVARALDRALPELDLSAFRAKVAEWIADHENKVARRQEQLAAKLRESVALNIEFATPITKMHAVATEPYKLVPAIDIGAAVPPGLLGQIAQYIYAQSPYPVWRIALAGAIGFLSGMCGRGFNIQGTGCNLYTLLVAPTSAGKESMSHGISKLAGAVAQTVPGALGYFGVKGVASGQALYRTIKERRAFLLEQGEFGIELEQLTDKRANAATRSLKKALLELFTKSGHGQQLGADVFAEKMKDTDALKSPALSILAETAPPHLYDNLTETMLADGFLPRFLLIDQPDISEEYNPRAHTVTPDPRLVELLAQLAHRCLLLDNQSVCVQVKFDDEANRLQDEYRSITRRQLMSANDEAAKQLWNRTHVKACRLAAIVAVGCMFDSPGHQPVVTRPMLEWAIALVNEGTRSLDTRFATGAVGSGDFRAVSDVKRFLARYVKLKTSRTGVALEVIKAGCISHSHLRASVGGLASVRAGIGGQSQTLYRVIRTLITEGTLRELPGDASEKQFRRLGLFYQICDEGLFE